METPSNPPQTARNEPCPCGSGKKYKRCHGAGAAPVLGTPKAQVPADVAGFDPSQMDPAMVNQVAEVMRRLPKGQLNRLQGLMSKMMAGKDVSDEARELERSMPAELLQMMQGLAPQTAVPAPVSDSQETEKQKGAFQKVLSAFRRK